MAHAVGRPCEGRVEVKLRLRLLAVPHALASPWGHATRPAFAYGPATQPIRTDRRLRAAYAGFRQARGD